MWAPASGADTTRWSQSTKVPENSSTACWNSTSTMRTSPDYSRDMVDGAESESQHVSRKMLKTIRFLAQTRYRPASKCVSPLPAPTAPVAVNGYTSNGRRKRQQSSTPARLKGDKPLSITQMEFFGQCYFEVSQRETPAGTLEQLNMVLIGDQDNRKAEFVELQKHFDCSLNLAIEALKLRAFLSQSGVMVLDNLISTDLLHIEMACTKLPPAYKEIIFAHLAEHLPFPKCFLLVYVRFLRLTATQRKLKVLVDRLRVSVDKEMPEQLQRHEWEVSIAKRLQWQQQADVQVLEPGTICEQTIDCNLLPSPKFQWTEPIEVFLWSVLETKMSMLSAEEEGGVSDSDRLMLFVNKKVVNIWPDGWMDADIILQEARRKL